MHNATNQPYRTMGLALLAGIILLTAALTACNPPPATNSTPTPESLKLGPGEMIRATMKPVAKPTEANPQVVLHMTITDEQTGKPVTAAFVEVNHKVVAIKVQEVKILLPGRLTEPRVSRCQRPVTKLGASRSAGNTITAENGRSPSDSNQPKQTTKHDPILTQH